MPNDPGYKMVAALYDVVPEVLLATGKVKNPWPNVDAHSGVLLQHYGIAEAEYYTVMFGAGAAVQWRSGEVASPATDADGGSAAQGCRAPSAAWRSLSSAALWGTRSSAPSRSRRSG